MGVVLLATACGGTVGGVAGYLLGRVVTTQHAQVKLQQYATRIVEEGERSTAESRRILARMNGSPYPACSDAELHYFNQLIFESQYLKAAGRMHGGKIACSTSLGRTKSDVEFIPDIVQRDGTRMYRDLAPFRMSGQTVIAIQLGDSYIVYSPYGMKPLLSRSMQFVETDLDAPNRASSRVLGTAPDAQQSYLTQDGRYRDGQRLYGTHCSNDGVVCATAYMTIASAIAANQFEMIGTVALGTITGILIGLVCAFLYRRAKGFESQLLRAIRRDALSVVYQPIVDLESGKIVEVEALARWTNEDNVPVSPDDFIKVAEAHGFVGQITRLVVRHVLRDFGQTLREDPGFRVNINIAAADLADPGFLPMLETALSEAGVHPCGLGIEITESYTARQQIAKDTILQLREKGHYVHIDDFGTGYSSLAYLHDLSVDAIKIDKAFTRAIGTDAVTVTILPQILTMAKTLGLRVIVEGIETPEQAAYFLKSEQSIYGQGWLFGRPVPPDVFLQTLAERKSLGTCAQPAESLETASSTVPAA